jgi:hypothetical protein
VPSSRRLAAKILHIFKQHSLFKPPFPLISQEKLQAGIDNPLLRFKPCGRPEGSRIFLASPIVIDGFAILEELTRIAYECFTGVRILADILAIAIGEREKEKGFGTWIVKLMTDTGWKKDQVTCANAAKISILAQNAGAFQRNKKLLFTLVQVIGTGKLTRVQCLHMKSQKLGAPFFSQWQFCSTVMGTVTPGLKVFQDKLLQRENSIHKRDLMSAKFHSTAHSIDLGVLRH